jgi:hypothetical protein
MRSPRWAVTALAIGFHRDEGRAPEGPREIALARAGASDVQGVTAKTGLRFLWHLRRATAAGPFSGRPIARGRR